jgi:hypothetical protein
MKPPSYSKVTTYIPKDFKGLAKRFHLTRNYLAFLILSDFCDHPPDGLWLISDDPVDARDDDEEPLAL